MKQYFIKGVDEPLEFGDTLGFDLVKKGDEGQSITKHVECRFIPEIIPLLLEEEVIEEKDIKEKPTVEDVVNGWEKESAKEAGYEDDDEDEVSLQEVIDTFYDFMDATKDAIRNLLDRVTELEKQRAPEKKDHDHYVTISDYLFRNKDIIKPLHNWTYNPNVEIFGFSL